MQGKDLVRWKYQRYMKDYLRCIAAVDDNLGRVLEYLDDTGLADNTVVIYSSDQGFYLGEHGWFDKRWMYEESLRTPLIVRWPGVVQPGSTNKDIVSNLDFAETFLDIAGVEVPADMQGRSLVPLLAGPDPGRLAEDVLLSLLRIPRGPQRAAALRRGGRALQADPLLSQSLGRVADRRVGVVRPEVGCEGIEERLRRSEIRRCATAFGDRTGTAPAGIEGPGFRSARIGPRSRAVMRVRTVRFTMAGTR